MDEKLSLLFNAVDAVWELINPLQAIGYDVVGCLDGAVLKGKYR